MRVRHREHEAVQRAVVQSGRVLDVDVGPVGGAVEEAAVGVRVGDEGAVRDVLVVGPARGLRRVIRRPQLDLRNAGRRVLSRRREHHP